MPTDTHLQDVSYRARMAAEDAFYKDRTVVHDLPPIYHYWSDKYLRPKMEAFGFSTPIEMFKKYLLEQAKRRSQEVLHVVSIGAGNCDLEIALASYLVCQGQSDFVIDCLEVNPTMLERGRVNAAREGVAEHIGLVTVDFNHWTAACEYDAVLANQSLHHVLNLEHLFSQIRTSLRPGGTFIISDIIGRNGHLRWPEALEIVAEFWRKLPPSYRYNRLLNRYEEMYENWDCSTQGFEGIRAQDILPLLLANFNFQFFMGFANVIDPFIDRAFGHNFDVVRSWDRAFIDQLHERDEREMIGGHIKPTHMLAVVGVGPNTPALISGPLAPESCVRLARESDTTSSVPIRNDAYECASWPAISRWELEIACQRLQDAENRIREQTKELEERAAWGHRLDKELEECIAWARRLEKEVEDRTAWALRLDKELAERTAWLQELKRKLGWIPGARMLYRLARKSHGSSS